MGANYVLLETITVGEAGASSVTFNNIPQSGYTDLKVVVSARSDSSAGIYDGIQLNINGSTASVYSQKTIYGSGSAAVSTSTSAAQGIVGYYSAGGTATASTFGNVEFYIPNYTSSNSKSISIDAVGENNATSARMGMVAGLFANSSTISSLVFAPSGGTSFVQYSTFSLYGLAAVGTTPVIAPYASGGDIIQTDGTYWYHAFLSSGTFTPAKGLSCDVLVVAGGGAGGGGGSSGGGGAGGLLAFTSQALTTSANTVTVGAGGAGSFASAPTNGGNSSFGSLTAAVGGGFGAPTSPSATTAGTGGSGGGASYVYLTGATATSGQGNVGGNGLTNGSTYFRGGGGGGAGSAGGNASAGAMGNGGAGTNSYSSWLSVTGLGVSGYIAGGGGAGGDYYRSAGTGTGGSGGGGNGGNNSIGSNGIANTGSGGGGGDNRPGSGTAGGNGGSGIVIVRYAI